MREETLSNWHDRIHLKDGFLYKSPSNYVSDNNNSSYKFLNLLILI